MNDGAEDFVWIDHISRTPAGWQLHLMYPRKNGFVTNPTPMVTTKHLPALDINHPMFYRSSTRMAPFDWSGMEWSERLVDPAQLLRQVVPRCPASRCHSIFRMPGDIPIYVPAFLLIQALFLGNKAMASNLMLPNGKELLGHGFREGNALHIVPNSHLKGKLSDPALRSLAWMISSEDARRSFASVLRYAREGRINLDVPEFRMSAWAWGFELDCGIFCFQLNGIDLHLPINVDHIVVHRGRKEESLNPYSPPVRSPWSKLHEKIAKS